MDNRRMRELEEMCIQEDPPFCQAACPLGMDGRGLCSDLAAGTVDKARAKVEEGLPLPLLLCRICDEPCKKACPKGRSGDPISMALLERYSLENGKAPRKRPSFLSPRTDRIALVGSGLAAMAALESLRAKRYLPQVYIPDGDLAARLREDDRLPRDLLDETLERLLEGLNVAAESPSLEKLSEFDGVVIADGSPLRYPGPTDDITFATEVAGLFSLPLPSDSPSTEARRGLEAVLSLERHLQGASLESERTKKADRNTRLRAPEDDTPSEAIVPSGGTYSSEEATAEAARCLTCQCLICHPWCLYLQEYGGSPRKYIRTYHNNLIINKGNRTANRMIDSCTLCGLCAEVCPTGLDVGQASLESRRKMVDTGHMPPSHHDYPLRDMASALEETDFLLDPTGGSPEWLFFPGCQLGASEPRWVTESYRYLTDRLESVALWVSCCGAPARWGGREALYMDVMDLWIDRWEELGRPKVVTACSSCHGLLKERLPEGTAVTLWETMDKLGLPEEGAISAETVTVSDPCTARDDRTAREAVRNLLRRRGLALEEHPRSGRTTECCGFGGLVFSANPDLAKRSAARRVQEAGHPMVVSCAMCRELYARTGHPTWHILELLLSPEGKAPSPRPFPGWSARRENREKLKAEMTSGTTPKKPSESLVMDEELRQNLDDRWIIEEEILKVIEEAQSGGSRLRRKDSDVYLAYSVLGERTLWVEYSAEGDRWRIHDSYSHRMTIQEVTR
ncbi:MAG: heterodisulfide reductase-related iron-sulfur binding cluster [Synergistota bacterium]|nr:heterodisulfide reductase-related iron-sulfur binding cluster [Synergistota bacterium]